MIYSFRCSLLWLKIAPPSFFGMWMLIQDMHLRFDLKLDLYLMDYDILFNTFCENVAWVFLECSVCKEEPDNKDIGKMFAKSRKMCS